MVVIATERIRRQVVRQGRLSWQRQGGGRVLQRAVPSLNLEAGDRLEPSPQLCDVAQFSSARLPFVAHFWRAHNFGKMCTDPVLHRNPLFTAILGTSPARTLMADGLHILYMGVCGRIIAAVVWAVIRSNPLRLREPWSVIHELTMEALKAAIATQQNTNMYLAKHMIKFKLNQE